MEKPMGESAWTGPRRWPIVTGCTSAGAACKHCWAARLAATRLKHHPHYAGLAVIENGRARWTGEVRFNEDILHRPLKWRKPQRVFPAHTGDLFHPRINNFTLHRIFGIMAATPHITWQVLTKRPGRACVYLRAREHQSAIAGWLRHHGAGPTMWPLANVWLGASVWDQRSATDNIPPLLEAEVAVRFISAEPLVGPLDLTAIGSGWFRGETRPAMVDALSGLRTGCGLYNGLLPPAQGPRLDWVIAGGESGAMARPMKAAWVGKIRDDCRAAGVPFFFKQWGGGAASGRLIDGLEYLQMPGEASSSCEEKEDG
jgi:protein gp37